MDRKYAKNNKALAFIKRNIYYIIMLLCLAAIATMVTITLLNRSKKPDTNVIAPPNNQNNDDDTQNQNDDNDDDDTQTQNDDDDDDVVVPPIVFATPVGGEADITLDYAMDTWVWHQTLEQWSCHDGIDFAGADGDDVFAAYAGTVETISYDDYYGHKVVINHGDQLRTIYYSLNEPEVTEGQTVQKGQKIGTMGNTAMHESLQGPHVHFSVTLNNKPIDPYEYLEIGDK